MFSLNFLYNNFLDRFQPQQEPQKQNDWAKVESVKIDKMHNNFDPGAEYSPQTVNQKYRPFEGHHDTHLCAKVKKIFNEMNVPIPNGCTVAEHNQGSDPGSIGGMSSFEVHLYDPSMEKGRELKINQLNYIREERIDRENREVVHRKTLKLVLNGGFEEQTIERTNYEAL